MSRLINRNIYTPMGDRTSIRLEPEFLEALNAMAEFYGQTRTRLLTLIQYSTQPKSGERTSAVRVEVLLWALGKRNSGYQAPVRQLPDAPAN